MKRKQVMPELFYERINKLVSEKGISLNRLSKDLNISTNTASDWVNDYRIMTVVNFMELSEYFNVNPMWLYGLDNERRKFNG